MVPAKPITVLGNVFGTLLSADLQTPPECLIEGLILWECALTR